MKVIYVFMLIVFGCSTPSSKKPVFEPLSKTALRGNEILVFGRFFDKNRKAILLTDSFTYTLDQSRKEFRPHLEGKKNFFWMTVPADTKRLHLKSLTSTGRTFVTRDGIMASSQISPSNGVAVYVGEIVPTTEKKLVNVEFLSSIRMAQNFLLQKRIFEGNFVLRKFESPDGLLGRIQEKSTGD